MKKRYEEIDICRGLGIVLVVLGHALKQTGELEGLLNILLEVIYSFHMPLFFILSGFTAVKVLRLTKINEKIRYMKNRAHRLLVPYFVIGLIYLPLKYYMGKFAVKPYDFSQAWRILIGDNPNTALWFCYILFMCSIIAALVINRNNIKLVTVSMLAVCCITYGFGFDLRLGKYFAFFLIGIMIRASYTDIKGKIDSGKLFLISIVVFVLANYLLYRGVGIFNVFTALSGSHIIYYVACRVSSDMETPDESGGIRKAIKLAGEYSMDIYIFSEPIMTVLRLIVWNILGLNYILCIGTCFVGAIFIAIPVSMFIVRRIKLFRILFLGLD